MKARRLPPEPLNAWLLANQVSNLDLVKAGINISRRYHNITDRIVDRIACHYGIHPTAIYGDLWWNDLLNDAEHESAA